VADSGPGGVPGEVSGVGDALKFTLPLPPSVNDYWRIFKNRILITARARQYKAEVRFRVMQQQDGLPEPLRGPVLVQLVVYRKRRQGDLDNFQKGLLDSLRGIAFEDDAQVVEIWARRMDDPTNPRVEVRVEAAG
jgi:crossover junction endodeoxyribonuclease RusA